jgi:general secretion pathway protein G
MSTDRSSGSQTPEQPAPAGHPPGVKSLGGGFFLSILKGEGRTFTGFTLLELMVVIAILGALSAVSIPMYLGYLHQARMTKAIADIYSLDKMIKVYQIDWGGYPLSLSDIGQQKLKDPWGNPYSYLNIQVALSKPEKGEKKEKGKPRKDRFLHPINNDFDLYSSGPDGKSVAPLTAKASQDDIIRASDGAFVGSAVNY